MPKRSIQKTYRQIKHWVRVHKNLSITLLALLLIVGLVSYAIYMSNRRLAVNPSTYHPLLNLIADVESKGNYNAYFSDAHNTTIDFTDMTVAEVMQWQKEFITKGAASSAVGRYQIIDSTLAGLVAEREISTDRKFDKSLQDELAIALLERRGGEKYVNEELTTKEFAANLAMEWASLPRVVGDNPQASYYDGDGLNKSLVKVDDVLKAVQVVEAK